MRNAYLLILLLIAALIPATGSAQSSTAITAYEDMAYTSYSAVGAIHPVAIHAWSNPVAIGPDSYISAAKRDSFYVFMRHNGNGQPQWTKLVKPALNAIHIPFHLIRTKDGNVVFIYDNIHNFTGASASLGIIKLDPDGNVLYSRKLSTSTSFYPTAPEPTPDSGFIVGAAGCIGFNYLFKFDQDGSVMWHGQYGQSGTPTANSMSTTAISSHRTGRYKVSGAYTNCIELFDVDENGDILKGAYFQNPTMANMFVRPDALKPVPNADGDYYWAGLHIDYSGTTSSTRSFLIARTDSSNSIVWCKRMRFQDSTQVYDLRMHTLPNGDVLLATNTYLSTGTYGTSAPALIRISAGGQVLSARRVGRDSLDDYHFQQHYGSLYLPYDSTILLQSMTERGTNLTRAAVYATGKLCVDDNLAMVSQDYTLTRYTFLGGGPAGAYATATVDYEDQDVAALSHGQCADTVAYHGQMSVAGVVDAATGIRFFPNPAQDVVSIAAAMPGRYDVTMCDATGRMVARQSLNLAAGRAERVSLQGLQSGVYTIQVQDGNGLAGRQKLTVLTR